MDNTIITDSLKKLEQSFVEKNFEQARDTLLNIKSKIPEGLFHYNLGSIQAAEGKYPAARYNFEIAKKKDFTHPALYKNIKTVEARLSVKTESYTFKESFMTGFLSLNAGVYLSAGLVLSILIVFIINKLKVKSILLTICICLFLQVPFLSKVIYFDKEYLDAINLKDIEVYQGPSKIYDVIDTLPAGRKFIVSKGNDGWFFITYPNRFSGWVERKSLATY